MSACQQIEHAFSYRQNPHTLQGIHHATCSYARWPKLANDTQGQICL